MPPDLPPLQCGDCTACCRGDTIIIRPDLGDEHRRWKTDFDQKYGTRTLRKGPTGNCIYLGAKGCRIHGRQPAMCRAYDCRVHYLSVLQHEGPDGVQVRLKIGLLGFSEGKRRVEALYDQTNGKRAGEAASK